MSEKSAGAAVTGQQGEREALAERALALAHFNDSIDHGVINEWVNADGFKAGRFTTDDLRALVVLAAQPSRVTPSAEEVAEAVRSVQGVPFVGPKQRKIASAVLALFAAQQTVQQVRESVPQIICLCGSTRFYDEFQQANYDLTMAGKIVLSVGFYPHSLAKAGHGEGVGHNSVEKVALDELHKRKIDLADRVLVLNVGGYIGSSTRSEVAYAVAHGVPVDYLEPVTPTTESED